MDSIWRYIFGVLATAALVSALLGSRPVAADTGEFSIQVSPSPLVATVKPGEATSLELKVHNSGSAPESLKIAPRAFKIDQKTSNLELSDDQVPDIASWISFSAATFSIQPGQAITEKVTLHVPREAGFSYAFALVIARTNPPSQTTGHTLKASVAIFSLINVDRPGAVRSLEVTRFATTKGIYEYLPAEFEIDFKNTGNTIVQPAGNIFIKRHSGDRQSIDTLSVNSGGGYILPGATRTLKAQWANGFQRLVPKPQPDGSTKDELVWDWNRLSDFRVGQYTAALTAIYDDGQRDVPLQSELSFWVIPWKMLLGMLVVVALVVMGGWSLVRSALRLPKKVRRGKMKL